jgi:hypothetical protein
MKGAITELYAVSAEFPEIFAARVLQDMTVNVAPSGLTSAPPKQRLLAILWRSTHYARVYNMYMFVGVIIGLLCLEGGGV